MKPFGVRPLLVLSILLTVISAAITYLNVQQKKEATSLVIHNYKVIEASTRLLSLLKDLEIGHRGYIITSDTIFLEPYQTALAAIDYDIDTLAILVREKPRQLEVLERQLRPMIERKKKHLKESFDILEKFGRDSASHFAGMKIEKQRMDSIHLWTQDIITYERTLLNEGNARLEQRYYINDVIRFGSFALIGITSLAALITIANKEKDNRRLLEELKEFNLQLEEKVKLRTQELQRANQDLVKLNLEKNQFLAIATHDLKAPLAGITGLLQLMKLDKDLLSSKHLEYVQLMEETCGNMQGLISDLLDLSHIEQGTRQINNEEINLAKFLSQLNDRFSSWASKKNISLSFNTEMAPKTMFSDPGALARVLDNLLSNAIKFSKPGKRVEIKVRKDEEGVCFDIRDEGPGIFPGERDKLFGRFQKLSARPTDGESSSGLGLSIVKDLVEIMKGTISVQSEPGTGSTFSVHLPQEIR